MKLKVKVVPGASKSEIAGWLGDELKLRIAAPPEKGKANKAAIALLANVLGVAESEVVLLAGMQSQHKLFAISGLSEQQARKLLDEAVL